MAPRVCPNKACNGTSFAQDITSGEFCCTNCGTVAEESNIVSEITFGESSAGAITVTGSFVAADQAHATSGGLHGHQGESRAQTIEKTRRRINAVAAKLQIQDHIAGNALQHFKLALSRNFVKGRKSHYVVSACLYLSCRLYGTDHMLLDFAEAICVNVFSIGSTYLQLIKCLGMHEIPTIDPHIFIRRFISKLDLSLNEGTTVMNDASKLTQRMGKDWLNIGRRPAGVAAACVLLAARMNNIRISKAQIVQIAKVGESTVQRRLDEFSNTSAGGLAVGVFRATMIESSADPPSFIRHQEMNKKAAERLTKEKEALERGEGLETDLLEMAREIDKNLTEVGHALEENEETHVTNTTTMPRPPPSSSMNANDKEDNGKDEDEAESEAKGNDQDSENSESNNSKGKEKTNRSPPPEKPISRAESFLKRYKEQKAAAIAAALASGNEDIDLSGIGGGIIGRVRENKGPTWISEVPDDPVSLSDVDDDEVDSSVLNEKEIAIKTQVWMTMNRDYLIEQENKRLKMLADEAAGITKTPKKRRRNNTTTKVKNSTYKLQGGTLPTATENTQQVLKQKAFSKKLNYQAVGFYLFNNKKQNEASGEGTSNA